jgi:hypothetical protein
VKDETIKDLISELGKTRENPLAPIASLLESTNKEVESLKKEQAQVNVL